MRGASRVQILHTLQGESCQGLPPGIHWPSSPLASPSSSSSSSSSLSSSSVSLGWIQPWHVVQETGQCLRSSQGLLPLQPVLHWGITIITMMVKMMMIMLMVFYVQPFHIALEASMFFMWIQIQMCINQCVWCHDDTNGNDAVMQRKKWEMQDCLTARRSAKWDKRHDAKTLVLGGVSLTSVIHIALKASMCISIYRLWLQ